MGACRVADVIDVWDCATFDAELVDQLERESDLMLRYYETDQRIECTIKAHQQNTRDCGSSPLGRGRVACALCRLLEISHGLTREVFHEEARFLVEIVPALKLHHGYERVCTSTVSLAEARPKLSKLPHR